MKLALGLAAALILFTAAHVSAQDEEVRNVFFDTIRAGDFQPTPIGVEDMEYIGNQYISGDDSALMQALTGVLRRDLGFCATFRLIEADSFFMQLYDLSEITLLGWRRLGADYMVRLEAEFPGTKMRVRWRLYDVLQKQQIARGTEELEKKWWRYLAHDVGNEIVRTLTGDRGIFRTKVVYAKWLGDAKELFIADYDGAHERQLTKNGSLNLSPSFHPTRDEVFFSSYMNGDLQLYKVNVRDGKTEQIGNFAGQATAPAVSPDGNKIACTLSKDGNPEIYVLDLSGRVIKRLTHNRGIDTAPTWSPDGRRIAFASDRSGRQQLYIMDADGLNTKRLTYEGYENSSPIWSQRGDRITFVSRTKRRRFDLASINVDGSDYRVLTQVGENENPHFSPDGKHIVFASDRLGTEDIYTMDITGQSQRRMTRSGRCSNPVWGPMR